MFNIGPFEAIVILAVLVGLFGKQRVKDMARDAGEASKELKKFGKDYAETLEEIKKPVAEVAEAEEPERATAEGGVPPEAGKPAPPEEKQTAFLKESPPKVEKFKGINASRK